MGNDQAEMLQAENLASPDISHGFFTRRGGLSQGVYASLNGGVGSRDAAEAVTGNRARMAAAMDVEPGRLMVPYQVHSAEALIISAPWKPEARPRCDALVTTMPGLGLGVTGADCGMVLFADLDHHVIGAAHAGWKGALHGVLEATLRAMDQCGARRASIVAVLGPMIHQASYEVGPELRAQFVEKAAANAAFFVPSQREGYFMLDLPGFIIAALQRAGVGEAVSLGLDTYADPERFYSYRRSTHLKEADYGRHVSAIALQNG
ncbi:MAG: peptidoglycan editing factor PgeF [Hyphomicrobiales bacterium]|nr:peptidoglycan editing factor PgeF [Hyphomicrobiales bacterium]